MKETGRINAAASVAAGALPRAIGRAQRAILKHGNP
jgi:hypothetical protein